MKKFQHGFTVIEGLLILVIVGIIAGTGWYVWNAQDKANKNLDSAAKSSQNVPIATKKISTFEECKKSAGSKIQESYPEVCVTKDGNKFTNAAQASNSYLVIKEWGVKMKESNMSSDAYYVQDVGGNNTDAQSYYNIDSHQLDALKANDGSCKGEYIGIIGRLKKNDPSWQDDPITVQGANSGKVIGDYIYTFTTHKQYAAPCLYDSSQNYQPIQENLDVYNAKVKSYTEMFNTIQAN